MSLLDGLRHRLYVLLHGERYGREIERELRFHLELETLAAKHDRTVLDAEVAARRALGNATYYREEVRRMTPLAWFDHLRQDLSYAWRGLRRVPGFAIAVVLTLGLGVGVNASLFSFLDALFLRAPEGVTAPGEVRRLYSDLTNSRAPSSRLVGEAFFYPMVTAIAAAEAPSIRVEAFTEPDSAALVEADARITIRTSVVTAGYFRALGVRPERGRFFADAEAHVDEPSEVIVLSDAFWRREFDADERILGKTIHIGSKEYTVIGVAARGFTGIDVDAVDAWLPIGTLASERGMFGEPWYQSFTVSFRLIARVPPSVSDARIAASATAAMRTVHIRGWFYDSTQAVVDGPIVRAAGPADRTQEMSISLRLAAVAAMVLLITCANVANLLLVRATRRRREIALRRALGVSTARLCGQLLTESLLLGAIGGVVALMLAFWAGAALRRLLLPNVQWATAPIEWRTTAFAIALSFFMAILAGLAPALQSGRIDLINSLKAGSNEASYERSPLRAVLLIVQTALSVVLLVGAGLFVRSLAKVRAIDLGYDVDHIMFVRPTFESPTAKTRLAAGLVEVAQRLRGSPDVDAVALASSEPMGGYTYLAISLPGRDSLTSFGAQHYPTATLVSADYFRATGVPLVAGRAFAAADRYGAGGAVIVSRSMSDFYWPGENPLGKCVIVGRQGMPCSTVVGVAADTHRMDVIEKPGVQIYLPLAAPDTFLLPEELIVRTNARHAAAVSARASNELRRVFPHILPTTSLTMAQRLNRQYRPWQLGAELFTALGLLALVVSAIGVYSVVAYSVSQRTREMGIRVALGARSADVLALVVGEGTRVVLVGIAVGAMAALAAGRFVGSLLYGVGSHDPLVLSGAAFVLLIFGIAASAAPAWRATKVDPVTALRAD